MSDLTQSNEGDSVTPRGPTDLILPVDAVVWREVRRMVGDRSVKVDDVSTIASQDPILVLEVLKTANALFYSGSTQPITSVKTAIVRLGSEVSLETVENLRGRQSSYSPEVANWFEHFRKKSRRNSIIARILAETLAKNLADECQTSGLFMYIGEMLAVAHFQDEYVRLASEQSRAGMLYHLSQKLKFDVERIGLDFLRKNGLPEILIFPIDRDARPKTPDRAILRPICQSAVELLEAFDLNKWEKLAPGQKLPPKSILRSLNLNDNQYLKVYERCAEFLFSMKMLDEQAKAAAQQEEPVEEELDDDEDFIEPEKNQLSNDIENLIQGLSSGAHKTEIVEREEDLNDSFHLSAAEKTEPRNSGVVKKVAPPQLRTPGGNAFVGAVSDFFEEADSSEDLLLGLLSKLTDMGPFKQAALIVVSHDRKQAIVVAQRGSKYGNGQKIEITDPLSPLAQCFSKVQSFGNRANQSSPFGAKAFALAPIDADHDTPVALYADCGDNGSITFEARRVFRTVVALLNERLPTIPGGIPIEIE